MEILHFIRRVYVFLRNTFMVFAGLLCLIGMPAILYFFSESGEPAAQFSAADLNLYSHWIIPFFVLMLTGVAGQVWAMFQARKEYLANELQIDRSTYFMIPAAIITTICFGLILAIFCVNFANSYYGGALFGPDVTFGQLARFVLSTFLDQATYGLFNAFFSWKDLPDYDRKYVMFSIGVGAFKVVAGLLGPALMTAYIVDWFKKRRARTKLNSAK